MVLNVDFYTTYNTKISPNFLKWKFCGKAQFPPSFEQFARNSTDTVPVPFHPRQEILAQYKIGLNFTKTPNLL